MTILVTIGIAKVDQDHLIKGLSNFMGENQSKQPTILPVLVAINTVAMVC